MVLVTDDLIVHYFPAFFVKPQSFVEDFAAADNSLYFRRQHPRVSKNTRSFFSRDIGDPERA
jgi:hypothetical protein